MREAIPAVAFSLATQGRFDRRVHTNTAAVMLLMQTGKLTIYRDPPRFDAAVGRLRHAMDAIWSKGRLVIAPTATMAAKKPSRRFWSAT